MATTRSSSATSQRVPDDALASSGGFRLGAFQVPRRLLRLFEEARRERVPVPPGLHPDAAQVAGHDVHVRRAHRGRRVETAAEPEAFGVVACESAADAASAARVRACASPTRAMRRTRAASVDRIAFGPSASLVSRASTSRCVLDLGYASRATTSLPSEEKHCSIFLERRRIRRHRRQRQPPTEVFDTGFRNRRLRTRARTRFFRARARARPRGAHHLSERVRRAGAPPGSRSGFVKRSGPRMGAAPSRASIFENRSSPTTLSDDKRR